MPPALVPENMTGSFTFKLWLALVLITLVVILLTVPPKLAA